MHNNIVTICRICKKKMQLNMQRICSERICRLLCKICRKCRLLCKIWRICKKNMQNNMHKIWHKICKKMQNMQKNMQNIKVKSNMQNMHSPLCWCSSCYKFQRAGINAGAGAGLGRWAAQVSYSSDSGPGAGPLTFTTKIVIDSEQSAAAVIDRAEHSGWQAILARPEQQAE